MPLNPATWAQLEAHGVTQEHLLALLHFLQCRRNGSFEWYGREGKLERCELRLVFPSRPYEIEQVRRTVLAPLECT